MLKKYYIAFLCFVATCIQGYGQEYSTPATDKNFSINTQKAEFSVIVRIVDKETKEKIRSAYVSVNGILYKFNFIKEYYVIKARVGDQLIVNHPTFETVYHKITSNEDIKIEVEDFDLENASTRFRSDTYFKSKSSSNQYFINLDSANYYKGTDIEKSLSFIENILRENHSDGRNAATYRLLADIYFEWKQYDLAMANYKNSLQYREDEGTKLELTKAAILIKEYDEAEKYLKDINTDKLGLFQKILVYESLGDIYLQKKNFELAKSNYQKALKIAEDNGIVSKVTDLNSELGDVLVAQGEIEKANEQFINTIQLAQQESPLRSITEKEKVANYYNSTQQFDKEIKLRKETLEETKSIPAQYNLNENAISGFTAIGYSRQDSLQRQNGLKKLDGAGLISNDSISKALKFNFTPSPDDNVVPGYNSINSQSINYKIGRALVQKEDYKEAIPFLEKSIKDADESSDLVIKKDATKKLSEVFDNVGAYDKAYTTYRSYVNLVDTLYVRKEQEIEQAKRFARRIAENRDRITSLEKDKELNDIKVSLTQKDQLLSQSRNKSQQYIIYSLLLGIVAMFVFAYLLFRSNKQQKLANNLLALKSMRSQMNPHFIFNALNSVNSFIAVNDERNANRYLSEFSVLMRSVLENSDEDFIPFSKEVELIELYVKLEHNRFKEKFDYEIDIDKAIDLDEYSIPPMLLQPYIENAIWHGLRYKEEKGKLEIFVKLHEEGLSVMIQDNGVGRKKSQELKTKNQLKQKSKGMSTIKKRISILNDMYQDRISVSVSDLFDDGTGTRVELLLKRD